MFWMTLVFRPGDQDETRMSRPGDKCSTYCLETLNLKKLCLRPGGSTWWVAWKLLSRLVQPIRPGGGNRYEKKSWPPTPTTNFSQAAEEISQDGESLPAALLKMPPPPLPPSFKVDIHGPLRRRAVEAANFEIWGQGG